MMVIRQMARDLAIATEVVACPTVREPDGLALSSRNVHLTAERARRRAGPAPGAARGARRAGRPASGRPTRCATRCGRRSTAEPLADVDYVSVADGTTLAELDRVDGPALLSLAVRFGTTRLIDNELLEPIAADLMPGMAAGRRILLAYLVYFAAIGAAVPVPAGLLPRPRPRARADRDPDRDPGRDPAAARPGLGRAGRPLPADAPDAAAGRGGRDRRRRRSCSGRATSRASSSAR